MNKKLKMEMVKQGVKNFDLAKYLGCDPAKVSRIVNEWLEPDEATKGTIAEFFKVPVDRLFAKGTKKEHSENRRGYGRENFNH